MRIDLEEKRVLPVVPEQGVAPGVGAVGPAPMPALTVKTRTLPAGATSWWTCLTSIPSGGPENPLLCDPGTMRVPPFATEKSSSSQTVFTITGESLFNRLARISLWSPCSGSPGRTMRALRLPRMMDSPKTCSMMGRVLG